MERVITICVKQNQYNVRGGFLHTIPAHEFTGFKKGGGFAYQKCRECECTFENMQTAEIHMAHKAGMRDRLSMSYGINVRSEARNFPHFAL